MSDRLIWSGFYDDMSPYSHSLQRIFKFDKVGIVDFEGNLVIDYGGYYFYKSDDTLFPIINNRTWTGDYYNADGTLALTKKQKIILIRSIPANERSLKISYNQFIDFQVTSIIAAFLSDYFVENRAYETSSSYAQTALLFNEEAAKLWEQSEADDELRFKIISDIFNLVSSCAADLVEFVCELLNKESESYALLRFTAETGLITVFNQGDWRIKVWEKDSGVDNVANDKEAYDREVDLINKLIVKQAKEAEERKERSMESAQIKMFTSRISQLKP